MFLESVDVAIFFSRGKRKTALENGNTEVERAKRPAGFRLHGQGGKVLMVDQLNDHNG